MRRILAVLALLALAATASMGGSQQIVPRTMFGGSNTDSTEQVSPWIPCRGANRILLRTWSSKAAFSASTDADSTYSDSIAVFKVAFSDSMLNTNPLIAGDSTVITSTIVTNVDTTTKQVGVANPPLQEALRGPGNGSGIITVIYPVTPGTITPDNNGVITAQYFRVYITPLRRNTASGGQSTAGKRVVGLKGLRQVALLVYENK